MPPTDSARRRALQPAFDLARAQVDAGTVPFAILGVAGVDGVVRLEAFGEPGGRRIGTDAVCQLASITKSITAIGVLQLVEAGTITLGAVDQRLGAGPGATTAWAPITAWHVLTHTTGIDDVDLESILRHGQGRDDLLRHLRAKSQVDPPGSRFHYVSFTFDLLVEAIALRTGEPYEAALRRRVLEPLGMAVDDLRPGRRRPRGSRRAARDGAPRRHLRRRSRPPRGVRRPPPGWRRAVELRRGPAPAGARDAPQRRARRRHASSRPRTST